MFNLTPMSAEYQYINIVPNRTDARICWVSVMYPCFWLHCGGFTGTNLPIGRFYMKLMNGLTEYFFQKPTGKIPCIWNRTTHSTVSACRTMRLHYFDNFDTTQFSISDRTITFWFQDPVYVSSNKNLLAKIPASGNLHRKDCWRARRLINRKSGVLLWCRSAEAGILPAG